MSIFRNTELHVDLGIIKSNYHCLRNMSRHQFFCPMIKADAYGHGDLAVAKALHQEGCNSFGVALYEEAFRLRERHFNDGNIFVFAPLVEKALITAGELGITPVIVSDRDVELLEAVSGQLQRPLRVHLKFNVGMQRLGLSVDKIEEVSARLKKINRIHVEAVCTHLPIGEDVLADQSVTRSQLERFRKITEFFGTDVYGHVFNSAAFVGLGMSQDETRHEFGARPGIALYGACPEISGVDREKVGLQEAMTLRTRIIHVQDVAAGEGVSYGYRWKATRPSRIGILPLGYADGLRRTLSGRIQADVDGQMFPMIGTICMDYAMVDLTDSKWTAKDAVGKTATLLACGRNQMGSHDWAKKIDTISYEIMTGFSQRVPRTYI